MIQILLLIVVPMMITGAIAAFIADGKDRSAVQFFVIGALLGPLGILWAALAEREPQTPKLTRRTHLKRRP